MSPLILALALFFAFAQGEETDPSIDNLRSRHEGVLKEVKGLILNSVKNVQSHLEDRVQYLHGSIQEATEKGAKSISDSYQQARDAIKKTEAPQVCLEDADQFLLKAQQRSNGSFLTCANLTVAAKDVVSIVFEAGKLGTELLLTADVILNGFSQCWTWNPFELISCWITWVYTAFHDLISTYSDLKNFSTAIGSLVTDIENQISYCRDQGTNQANKDTLTMLQRVNHCARTIRTQ